MTADREQPMRPDGLLGDTLARLGHEYRHLQQEHHRARDKSALRRSLEQKMQAVRERFERGCSQWIDDHSLREAWREHFHKGGALPEMPQSATPPVFKGVTETNSSVEVLARQAAGYEIVVDGAIERHDTAAWYLEPEMIEPIHIGEHQCREVFDAPSQALEALREFQAAGHAEPPWRWARALYEDGLVDDQFALTPRGARALRSAAPQLRTIRGGVTFGVLVADAARARVFLLRSADGEHVPTVEPLTEVLQTTRPERRARDSEILADSRPGLRREGGHGPRHGVSDRRTGRRHAQDQRFADQMIEDAMQLWRAQDVNRAILVASPKTLGLLRRSLTHARGAKAPWSLREHDRELTRLTTPALHDALAIAGLLPSRGRMPTSRASPSLR